MYCPKCHAGSEHATENRCPQCHRGRLEVKDSPFPKTPQGKGSGKPNGKTARKRSRAAA
jgi:hypothetical protein